MRRHVELLDEIAESRLGAVAQCLSGVVVGEEHEDVRFCSLLRLLLFCGEPGARFCGAEEEEGCPRQHCSNAEGFTGVLFRCPPGVMS